LSKTLTNVLCTDYIVLMMHFTYPLIEVYCSLAVLPSGHKE